MSKSRGIAVCGRSSPAGPTAPISARHAPEIVKWIGQAAEFAWEEFFRVELANPQTRKDFVHAVKK
jgi:hypothetical protein